ncbi:MAG: crotonase/enoyl-CoA hydratase family protein [Acidobacteriota bacterium]
MLTLETRGPVTVAHLDDGKANAVGHAFLDAAHQALDAAAETSALVFVGREGVFSAGFDLKELQKGPSEREALVGRGAHFLHRLFTHPQPVVAAATGHAIAAGALILLASDTRVGARGDFKVGLNETAIDMALPVFGLELAKARLDPRQLTAAVTQATIYDIDRATEVGYLDELVDPDAVLERAVEIATGLAELPAGAYAANKMGVRQDFAEVIAASLPPSE